MQMFMRLYNHYWSSDFIQIARILIKDNGFAEFTSNIGFTLNEDKKVVLLEDSSDLNDEQNIKQAYAQFNYSPKLDICEFTPLSAPTNDIIMESPYQIDDEDEYEDYHIEEEDE